MSWQDPGKSGGFNSKSTEVSFLDASAFFSEGEWTLLQEWQKQLYRNVMNEIHQALISLGPLIATTVFSLKIKEKEEMSPREVVEFDRRLVINRSTKEPVSILIDHLGKEVNESNPSSTSGHNIASVSIKEEEEACYTEYLVTKRKEIESIPTADDADVTCILSQTLEPDGEIFMREELDHVGKCTATDDPDVTYILPQIPEPDRETFLKEDLEHEGKYTDIWSQSDTGSIADEEPPIHFESETNFTYNPVFNHPQIDYNEERLFSCNKCEKQFIKKSQLIQHQRIHIGVKTFACSDCGKGFAKKSDLQRHQIIHTGEKPFRCTKCEKSFTQPAGLKRHQGIHPGENPYPCTLCDKSFTYKSDLQRHQRNHMADNPF